LPPSIPAFANPNLIVQKAIAATATVHPPLTHPSSGEPPLYG
jgi:hypothetical protein